MRLVAWNILHGGGNKRTPEIALRLAGFEADLVILSEFRRTTGGQIAGVLHDRGLIHQIDTDPPPGRNGMLLASRTRLRKAAPPPTPAFGQRWIDVLLPDLGLFVTGIHAPDSQRHDANGRQRQAVYWRSLTTLSGERSGGKHLIAGDLNAGRRHVDESGDTLTGAFFLGILSTLGYRDMYRDAHPQGRETTWSSHTGAGFRLDAVWGSRAVSGCFSRVFHDEGARRSGASDHAPVVADFELPSPHAEENPEKTGAPALARPKLVR